MLRESSKGRAGTFNKVDLACTTDLSFSNHGQTHMNKRNWIRWVPGHQGG